MDSGRPRTVTIFHLSKSNGEAVFLHPFDDPGRFLDLIRNSRIEGRFGREPQYERFTHFREELHAMADAALRRANRRTSALPRLVASGVTLAAALLIPSFLLPGFFSIWGTVVVATCGAILAYLTLSLRDMRSVAAAGLRQEVRAKIDHIYFESDHFTLAVERELELLADRSVEGDLFLPDGVMENPAALGWEEQQFLACLESHLRPVGRLRRGFRSLWKRAGNGVGWDCSRLDRPLSALYERITGEVGPVAGEGSR